MNDIDFTFNESIKPILMGAKTAQDYYRKTSVSALARDLILQYPVLISADIPIDDAIVLAKALELQYASLQIMVLSADTAFGVDPSTTAGVRDLLSRYHSNSDRPNMVSYAGNLIYNVGSMVEHLPALSSAETEISLKDAVVVEQTHSEEFLLSLWDKPISAEESTTLNDLYNPSTALIETVANVADSVELRFAKEDGEDGEEFFGSIAHASGTDNQFNVRKLGNSKDNRYATDLERSPNGRARKDSDKIMVKLDKEYTRLEPTMIELEFFVRNGDDSAMKKAIIGISAMPRAIPADVMRANIIKALQHDNTGFKFIAWTRGEQKVVKDFIFNVSNIKADAMAKSRYDKWFAALRKRKMNAKAFRGSRQTINPLTSLIITKNDAALIKQTSGFDLLDENTATKLMDSLYLLCFMVVDTDTGLVSTLLDGQRYFTETTISHLKKSNKDKSNDLTNVREMLKLLGR